METFYTKCSTSHRPSLHNYLAFQSVGSPRGHCSGSQPDPPRAQGGPSGWGPRVSGSRALSPHPLQRSVRHRFLPFLGLFCRVSARHERCSADPGHSSMWVRGRNRPESASIKCQVKFTLSADPEYAKESKIGLDSRLHAVMELKKRACVTDHVRHTSQSAGRRHSHMCVLHTQHCAGATDRNVGIKEQGDRKLG